MITGGKNKNASGFTISVSRQWHRRISDSRKSTRSARQPGTRQAGFTIVETMIVLAVTGIMLTSALLYISGKQNRTEFQTSINNMQQTIQQIINETTSGYYGDGFSCTASAGSVNSITLSDDPTPGGTCLYAGKVIQFGDSSTSGASLVRTYPLVGSVRTNTGVVNTNILNTNPVAVTTGSNVPSSTFPDVSKRVSFGGSLDVLSVKYGGTPTGALALMAGDATGTFSSVDTNDSSGKRLKSGSQQFSLYAVDATTPNMSLQSMATKIDTSSANLKSVSATTPVSICVKSNTVNQYAVITIGGGSDLTVSLKVQGATVCT